MCAISFCCIFCSDGFHKASRMFWFFQHLLVKRGIHNNPEENQCEFWQRSKVVKSQILKGSYCWRKKCCTVWHASNPSKYQDIYFHNHQSHIWLITTEISLFPHTNDLFKGTSSTRKGGGFFGSGRTTRLSGELRVSRWLRDVNVGNAYMAGGFASWTCILDKTCCLSYGRHEMHMQKDKMLHFPPVPIPAMVKW